MLTGYRTMIRTSLSCRTLAMFGIFSWALAAVPGSLYAQATATEGPVKNAKTPLEMWDEIDYLVRVGQASQAVPYLEAFRKSNPDDAVMLEIRDRYGPGSIMRLNDDPATREQARPIMGMLAAATHHFATNPERIARLIGALSKSREEQTYAVEGLRESGSYAVPYLVEALRRPSVSDRERALIAGNLARLDRSAVPALLTLLDSGDVQLTSDAITALGEIGDPRVIPYLMFIAVQNDSSSSAPRAAKRAIERLTGRAFNAQPVAAAPLLVNEARKYHTHAVLFPSDKVEIWTWDGTPTPHVVSRSEAEEILGLRFAREALQLQPGNVSAQVVFLSIALEKAAQRVGLGAFPSNDPSGIYPAALAAGPAILGQVLRTALADGHSELAAVAAFSLGRVTNRDALAADGRSSPLVEALASPDRRVQFAAAQALVLLDPQKAFPGSSRVVPTLARFVTNQSTPRAVVVDSNPNRGGQVVAFLRELGYDPLLAPTGDQGFRLAAESADVELIIIEPSLADGSWRLIDTLTNLRADARTAGVPVFLVGPLNIHNRLRIHTTTIPRLGLLVTPVDAAGLKTQLDRRLDEMGARPLSPEESSNYAKAAAIVLARVASQPGGPFEKDLARAEPALTIALAEPGTGLVASAVLGDVPDINAQRGLADTLLDPSKPPALRLSSAAQLGKSIQRFGPLLRATQEKRLSEALDQATDPALRNALASVIGALRPGPDVSGKRLQSLGTPAPEEAAPAQPAPTPDGAPATPPPNPEPAATPAAGGRQAAPGEATPPKEEPKL